MYGYRDTDMYKETLNSKARNLLVDRAIDMSEGKNFPQKFKDVIMDLVEVIKKGSVPLKVMAIAGVLYLINPMDIIPDFVPIMGFADDMFVMGAILMKIREVVG